MASVASRVSDEEEGRLTKRVAAEGLAAEARSMLVWVEDIGFLDLLGTG